MNFLLPCGGIMNNIDLLKTITNYKKIKNPAYPAQESLLIHLYIRVNDKIQSIIENELSEYRINTSTFMVLVSLYMSDDYCQSPSDIYKELQFSKTNITHIIDKLEKKNIAKRINNKNTMIVGDPLQAIYSFRGGRSEYIMRFDQDYSDVKIVHLNTNYRCSTDIVRMANMLAQHIPDSKDKNYVESIASKGTNQFPEYRKFVSEYDEASWICKKITEKRENNEYRDMAVLARTNAQLTILQTVMSKNMIPYDVVNGVMFTELPEIKLLISYLKLALHEGDNSAFSYVYNKPNRWLDQKFFAEVKENATRKNTSLYNAMFTIDRRNWRFKNGIDQLYEVVNTLQNRKFESVGKMIEYLRFYLKIDDFVSKGKQADDGGFSEQIENMDAFQNIADKYFDLNEFMLYLDDINRQVAMENNDKVHLSTIHRAKGLEYPIVFIVGLNDGLLPHAKSDNLDDERRLLYVGITRAENELYLSSTASYNDNLMTPSPFIDELGDSVKKMKC